MCSSDLDGKVLDPLDQAGIVVLGLLQFLDTFQGRVNVAPEGYDPSDKTNYNDRHRNQTQPKLERLHVTLSQTAPASEV